LKKAANKEALSARRRKIATEKVIKGRKLSDVAAELGIARETASKDFNAAETQGYIRELLGKHDAEIEALVDKALLALDAGLGAGVVWQGMERANAEGVKVADHKTRLRAVRETLHLAGLRAGRNDDGSNAGIARNFNGTMEELLILYRRVTTPEDSGLDAETQRRGEHI
jgi:hypothetical protein